MRVNCVFILYFEYETKLNIDDPCHLTAAIVWKWKRKCQTKFERNKMNFITAFGSNRLTLGHALMNPSNLKLNRGMAWNGIKNLLENPLLVLFTYVGLVIVQELCFTLNICVRAMIWLISYLSPPRKEIDRLMKNCAHPF